MSSSMGSSSVNHGSSPIKHNINSSYLHKTTFHSASTTRDLMAKDMTGLFIGPMPFVEFLKEFLPTHGVRAPRLPKLFNEIVKTTVEKNMYTSFIELVCEHKLMPQCQVVDTSRNPDIASRKDKRIQPDLSIYDKDVDISENVMQYSELQTFIEFKPDELSDPFCDPPSDISPAKLIDFQFEAVPKMRRDCRGQITSYATEMLARQHRTRAFSIYIGDPCVRLICWDRSGAVVTEKFNFRENSQPLVDFLWYFGRASNADRGRDQTVRIATREETKLAVKHLERWKNEKERPVIVFEIQDGDHTREFIAWGSMADPESLTGRATRAYPVYEKATKRLYFLKDSWRAASLERESDILRELNESEVRNVPMFVCGGDVLGHATLSQTFGVEDILEEDERKDENENEGNAQGTTNGHWAAAGITHRMIRRDSKGVQNPRVTPAPIIEKRRKSWICGSHNLGERIHHRFVEDFIGQHLDKFTSSKQFMKAVFDAFIAHGDAYEKCNILHRDVSAKNVIMTDGGRGILNDWDLARRVSKDAFPSVRQHERTGTWQFISTLNLMYPGTLHVVQDDIESFVILVLYHGLRYMRHNAFELKSLMFRVFDDGDVGADGYSRGGQGKRLLFTARGYLENEFEFTDNDPMTQWIDYGIEAVGEWLKYILPAPKQTAKKSTSLAGPEPDDLELRDNKQLIDQWERVLAMPGWPSNDKAFDQCPKTSEGSTFGTLKREADSGGGEDPPKKKRSKTNLVSSSSRTLRSSSKRTGTYC